VLWIYCNSKESDPKKIAQLWKELDIESIGELEYACNENRLIELKGFGTKTQTNILEQIRFINQNSNKFLWANLESLANEILLEIQEQYPDALVSVCGEFRRKFMVLDGIDFLVSVEDASTQQAITENINNIRFILNFLQNRIFTSNCSSYQVIKNITVSCRIKWMHPKSTLQKQPFMRQLVILLLHSGIAR
jgi:DNA polymerase/3'-5' exonuclease PolX